MKKKKGLIFGAIFVLAILFVSLGSVSAATPVTNTNHNNFFNQLTNLWNKITGHAVRYVPESVFKPSVDITPKIAYWWGKVNQHIGENGTWMTDPDGVSGANLDKLAYCQKWYPNTISVKSYKNETISDWRNRGNVGGPFTNTKQSYECVQGNVTRNESIKCVDSDGGLNYYVKGSVSFPGSVFSPYVDSCNVDGVHLRELYCNSTSLTINDLKNNLVPFGTTYDAGLAASPGLSDTFYGVNITVVSVNVSTSSAIISLDGVSHKINSGGYISFQNVILYAQSMSYSSSGEPGIVLTIYEKNLRRDFHYCSNGCLNGACLYPNETKPSNSSCSNGTCLIFDLENATFNGSEGSGVFAAQILDSNQVSIEYYYDNISEFTSILSQGESYKFNNYMKIQLENIIPAQTIDAASYVVFNYSFSNQTTPRSYCTPSGNCTLYKGDSIIYPYSFEGQKETLNFSIDPVFGIWSQNGKENVELNYAVGRYGDSLVAGQQHRMGDQLITMMEVPLNGPINFQVSPITNSANCTFLNQTVVSGEKYVEFSCSLGGYLGNEIYINSLNVSSRDVGSVVFHIYNGNLIDVRSFPQKLNDLWSLNQTGSIKVLGFTPGQESSDGSEKVIFEVMGVHIPTTTQKESFSNSENTTSSGNTTPSCNGCALGGKCYDFGYRINDTYCSTNGFVNQSTQDSVCQNNFECSSNLCINSQCVSGSVWNKLLDWFQKLFG